MLTARLLWRPSSNLRTLCRGCCSRPPNGLQSGWGMKSHNEELRDPLCCRQCWWLHQNKMQLSARKQVYLFFFCFCQMAIYYCTDVIFVISFPLYEKSILYQSYQKHFIHTAVLHWYSLSCDINALTSMLLCEKNEVYQKKKAQKEQVQQFAWENLWALAAAKISFPMVSLFHRLLLPVYRLTQRGTLELKLLPEKCIINCASVAWPRRWLPQM